MAFLAAGIRPRRPAYTTRVAPPTRTQTAQLLTYLGAAEQRTGPPKFRGWRAEQSYHFQKRPDRAPRARGLVD